MQLNELQSDFLSNITADLYRASKALKTKRLIGLDSRLKIYRRNYYGNHCHALADTYARVKKTVGDGYFKSLAMEYIAKYPSTSGDLNDFGNHFPEFIKTDAIGRKTITDLPYLADLAKLEWYTILSLRAPRNETPLEALLHYPQKDLEHVRFQLNPACFILHSTFPIYNIWCLAKDENAIVNIEDGGQSVCVTRVEHDIRVVPIDKFTALLIEQWSKGCSFGDSLEYIASRNSEVNITGLIREVSKLNIVGAIA